MDNIEYLDIVERSDNDIIVDLGKRFKAYRIALRLTQKDIAEQSGVSVMTIVRFENGEKKSIGLQNFIALMRAIQRLDSIAFAIPQMPDSLYEHRMNEPKRVRRRKNEK